MTEVSERADYIIQELSRNGRVSVDLLSQQLHVDASTIRRDLEKLDRQKLLRRVYGGAVPVDTMSYSTYAQNLTHTENMNKQVDEKMQIASIAAELIQPGDTITLSPGTTTTYLARVIREMQIPNLTVVTNAINIAIELAGLASLNLIVTGGIVLSDFFALVGPLAEQSLQEMYVDKAFIGVTGISPDYGLSGPNQLEALTYRATIKHARKTIVLADHTKLGWKALYKISPLNAIHMLITDTAASPEIIASIEEMGIAVLTSSSPAAKIAISK